MKVPKTVVTSYPSSKPVDRKVDDENQGTLKKGQSVLVKSLRSPKDLFSYKFVKKGDFKSGNVLRCGSFCSLKYVASLENFQPLERYYKGKFHLSIEFYIR